MDYASYDWVKLDPSLPATRDVVNQYWRLYHIIKTQVLTENKYEVFLLREVKMVSGKNMQEALMIMSLILKINFYKSYLAILIILLA